MVHVEAIELLHFLSEPTRNRILATLLQGEKTVGDLVAATDREQSNVSHHLRFLRREGMVVSRREGRRRLYKLADPRFEEILTRVGRLAVHLERTAYYRTLKLHDDAEFHGYG